MRRFSASGQQGQSLILLALLAVILLGTAGVALDGGWVLVQRRRAQNTADNSALAAALKIAQNQSSWQAEGLAVALQNGYDDDGATNTVTVVNPPYDGAFAGNSAYVQVTITQTVSTAFIQLVYTGPVRLTVRAVARALPSPELPVETGNAVIGLNRTACDTIKFTGSGDTHITGGGVFSNSSSPGQTCYSGRKTNASGSVTVDEGGINMADDWDQNPGASVSPPPTWGVDQFTYPDVADPDCDGVGMTDKGDYQLDNGTDTITPGRYDAIVVNPSALLTMEPGLYCITDDDFSISGGLTGIGVHIYMGPSAGAFNTNAGSTIILEAAFGEPTWTCDDPSPVTPEICDQAGLLLHVDELNTNTIHINGGAATTYIGTFLAPSARIVINGGSGTSGVFNSQIIGDTVEIAGNADVNIIYDPEQNYTPPIPPKVWLAE